MPDKYEALRYMPFTDLASALGIDLSRYRRSTHNWQGWCPIHQPKKNCTAFGYSDDGKFNCASCGAKGRGAIDLVKAVRGVGFHEAVELLGNLATEAKPAEARTATAANSPNGHASGQMPTEGSPFKGSYEKFQVPSPWLEARIPDESVRKRYGFFCYSNPARKSAYTGRIMIPVKRFEDGALMGYLARATEGEPKYLWPKGFPKHLHLFGAWELKAAADQGLRLPAKVVYVLESPFAVLKFASYGLPAVSPFGWSVSPEQLDLLAKLTRGAVYLPDSDKAEQATGIAGMIARRLWCKAPALPTGIRDPEELTKEAVLAL